MTPESSIRARQREREAADRAARWRHQRAVARVRVVDEILAEYATSYCGRALRRTEVAPMESAIDVPGITWSIGGDVMVEYLYNDRGPSRVLVHELALFDEIKRNLRSRHVTIERRSRS